MRIKILVADDDYDNRSIAQEALEAAGFEVVLATNGAEVLEKISDVMPSVLLLDLSMPKVSGWEVAKQLRERSELSKITIIAFTAHALVGDELKAKAAGCDDYLSKPCLPKDIVQKVMGWVGDKGAVSQRPIHG